MNYHRKSTKKTRWRPLLLVVTVVVCVLLITRINTYFHRDGRDRAGKTESESGASGGSVLEEGSQGPQKLRKVIYDRNMGSLAESFRLVSLYIRPLELDKKQMAVPHLVEILGLDGEGIAQKLRTERSFLWLKKNIESDKAEEIKKLQYEGVYLVEEEKRFYLQGHHAAHAIGFVEKGQGLAGVEFTYDNILRGEGNIDAVHLAISEADSDLPGRGANVVLSLDIKTQVFLEEKLNALLQQTEAQSGMAVVMDAVNGEIFALANLPSFDPNLFWRAESYEHKNRVLNDPVYLGGLNNYFRAAAEMEAGNIPQSYTLQSEVSDLVIRPKKRKVAAGRNTTGLGWQTWQEGIYLSPRFSWPLTFNLNDNKLMPFCGILGLDRQGNFMEGQHPILSEEKDIDCKLSDDLSKTTSLNLAAAFSQMINGGKAITPHLLHGLWLDGEERFLPSNFAGSYSVKHSVSDYFLELLRGRNHFSDGNLIIESMVVEKNRPEDIEFADDRTGGSSEQSPDQEEVLPRFSTLALGAALDGSRKFVVVLAVDGAAVNLKSSSPMRKLVDEVLTKGRKMSTGRKGSLAPQKRPSRKELYVKWSNIHQKKISHPFMAAVSSSVMPDLQGLSLRKALQQLQGFNLKLVVEGAGRISGQSVKAGSRVSGQETCVLRLKIDSEQSTGN